MNNLIEKAQDFAHRAHDSIQQKRKYTGEPYWVHTDEVAQIVEKYTKDFTPCTLTFDSASDMIIAAHLHDVLEDVTPINPEFNTDLIRETFGWHVLDLVIGLTDVYTKEKYPKLNRKERKALETRRLSIENPLAKTIKLADLKSNTKSIVEQDKGFAITYIKEKIALLPYLSDGDSRLFKIVKEQALAAAKQLNIEV